MNISRDFLPYGEWLYFKLYSHPKKADAILIALYPTIERLTDNHLMDLFFFIRYNDPFFHLRLRFRCLDSSSVARALMEEFNDLFEKKIIYDVLVDSYHREVERYGGDSILIAEKIFNIDSLHTVRMLDILQNNNQLGTNERWLLALTMIDNILEGFNFSTDKRLSFMQILSTSMQEEFRFTTNSIYNRQIDERYRSNKENIYRCLAKDIDNLVIMELRAELRQLREILHAANIRQEARFSFISSVIHMSMNRWFETHGRAYELFLYSFLAKYYKTKKIVRTIA